MSVSRYVHIARHYRTAWSQVRVPTAETSGRVPNSFTTNTARGDLSGPDAPDEAEPECTRTTGLEPFANATGVKTA